MPVDEKIPVLDLKPLQYNPFLDGTVVYDNAGGVLVPRSASGMIAPLDSNPLTDPRPSNASTQQLIDSAQSVSRNHVVPNAAAPRGYEVQSNILDPNTSFDPDKLSRELDGLSQRDLNDFIDNNLSNPSSSRATSGGYRVSQNTNGLYDANSPFSADRLSQELDSFSEKELNDFIDDTLAQSSRTAAEAAAASRRQLLDKAIRRGSQAAGALGLAADVYNVGNALLDPTNNPADEIGDFLGSTLGGALGTPFGPAGALAGSILGGWLGKKAGDLLQGDGSRERFDEPGEPDFQGGQCYGVPYRIAWSATTTSREFVWIKNGPISVGSGDRGDGGIKLTITSSNDGTETAAGAPPGTELRFDKFDVTRVDGQPDNCGNPDGPSVPKLRNPFYAPTTDPIPSPPIDSIPAPDRFPTSPDGLPSTPTVPTLPDSALPGVPGGNELDDPPGIDDLPEPRAPQVPSPDVDPNPKPDCCESNALKLDNLLDAIEDILYEFSVTGSGSMNLPECESETPYDLGWQGVGLDGIYQALENLSQATERVWGRVKCDPETTAAAPMAWHVKTVEHPQLIVLWGASEGGSSRWSMHIPHPKSIITEDYDFKFPVYKKGGVNGTLVLSDNTRLVVNGASEAECKKVIFYCKNLIENTFLENSKEIYSKGGNNNKTVQVQATYIKAFSGYRDQFPLWATRL